MLIKPLARCELLKSPKLIVNSSYTEVQWKSAKSNLQRNCARSQNIFISILSFEESSLYEKEARKECQNFDNKGMKNPVRLLCNGSDWARTQWSALIFSSHDVLLTKSVMHAKVAREKFRKWNAKWREKVFKFASVVTFSISQNQYWYEVGISFSSRFLFFSSFYFI